MPNPFVWIDLNLTRNHCIEAVAWALRWYAHQRDLDGVLADIGPAAVAIWQVDVDD